MVNEIEDSLRKERAASTLGREIMTDIVITSIGTGLIVLAILLAGQGLSLS
jgi:hypothetical protein